MTFSPLATGDVLPLGFYVENGKKYRRFMDRNRGQRFDGITFHHIVGGIDSLAAELVKTSRTLSVNYGIARDGTIHGCVAEEYKANTSSHQSDHTHITVEVANESLAPDYRISDESFDAAARLAADCGRRLGFVPSASTIRFHREFFATACPGPTFWARRAELIALARRYYDEGEQRPTSTTAPAEEPTSQTKEVTMIVVQAPKAIYTLGIEFIRHELDGESAKYLAGIYNPGGKILVVTQQRFLALLDANGIPRDAPDAIAGGKSWAQDRGVVDVRGAKV